MGDKTRGIYNKYQVSRVDRTDGPGEKHEDCFYFVLDVTHDPHSLAALCAYANSCRLEYPKLAADLDNIVKVCSPRTDLPIPFTADSDILKVLAELEFLAEHNGEKIDQLNVTVFRRLVREAGYELPEDFNWMDYDND